MSTYHPRPIYASDPLWAGRKKIGLSLCTPHSETPSACLSRRCEARAVSVCVCVCHPQTQKFAPKRLVRTPERVPAHEVCRHARAMLTQRKSQKRIPRGLARTEHTYPEQQQTSSGGLARTEKTYHEIVITECPLFQSIEKAPPRC